jgi:glycosyltransferase involved in cell wall biosynthesis
MNAAGKHNILIITDTFLAMAGSERNITQLMRGIDKERFQLYMACIYAGKLAQSMREEGYPVFDLRRGGIYTVNGLRNIICLRNLIREKNISLIVTYHEASDFYGLALAKICNIPIISSRRDMGYKTRLHHKVAYKLTGRLFDAEITVSYAVKEEMIKQGWFPAQRIFPIYNGVDLNEYDVMEKNIETIKKNNRINPGHLVVGLVANLRRIKGVHFLIEAASMICKKRSDVEFVIVGGNLEEAGYGREDLESLAKRLEVDRNIHFLGKRSDIVDLISLFDVAVVASLSEGFSNTILEYMASSKPVVATAVGGNAEAVVHGKTGLLVPPGDSQALAAAVQLLLGNKEIASRFGTAARKRVEEMFTLEAMIKKYEQLFEQVILGGKYDSPFAQHAASKTFCGVIERRR